jgi:hypothetical protein
MQYQCEIGNRGNIIRRWEKWTDLIV